MTKSDYREVGEKKITTNHPELVAGLEQIMNNYGAGDPMKVKVKYTHLTPKAIANKLAVLGHPHLSTYAVEQLLQEQGCSRRKLRPHNTYKDVEGRNEQFEHIAMLREEFETAGLPILSIDTKKREYLGDMCRPGTYYAQHSIHLYDHTFDHYADGVVIPHGIYDTNHNQGYITLGNSSDTSAFACDNLAFFWETAIRKDYPSEVDEVLLLCDGGGSNSCRQYSFKKDLYRIAQQLNLRFVVAHYPTYCSKWNPIEHRLFCHLTQAWDGLVFENIQIVKEQAARTSTKTGLQVQVQINNQSYKTGRKCPKSFKNNVDQYVDFNEKFPIWNYSIDGS